MIQRNEKTKSFYNEVKEWVGDDIREKRIMRMN
jgi:hypothetical protein